MSKQPWHYYTIEVIIFSFDKNDQILTYTLEVASHSFLSCIWVALNYK